MSRSEFAQISGIGSAAPGQEYLKIVCPPGDVAGSLAVYISVPSVGHVDPSFVRANLFSDLGGTRQHLASAICPAGTSGEIISVSGHPADSYHLTLQATRQDQPNVKVGMAMLACCASPRVRVRPDLLSLAFAPTELGLGDLQWFPVAPWGIEEGAPNAYTVSGTGSIPMPLGARLVHWLALGQAGPPASSVEFDGLSSGPVLLVGAAAPMKEGFPAAQDVSAIVYTNLAYGLFEIVV